MATGRVPTTANSPLTAKGDLFTYSTAPARLAVGNNGEQIVADSSTSTGLRYQVAKSVNHVINGGMDIWQRGTSFASTNPAIYTTDRFQFLRGGAVAGGTLSRQNTSDTTNLPNIQYCARVGRDSGNTSTAVMYFATSIESQETRQLQGQPIVLSFYARAGANYSAASSVLAAEITSGTGTDQNIFSGFTGQASVAASNKTLTTTWQRFTVTGTVGATATQLCVLFNFTPVGTAGANDYAEITGVQLELGTVPTPFQRSGGTLQGELAACQRYYQRLAGGALYSAYSMGIGYSATRMDLTVPLKVTMRTTPSTFDFSNIGTYDDPSGTITAISGVATTATLNGNDFVWIQATVASGLTQYRNYWIVNNNNAAGYLGFSAEL